MPPAAFPPPRCRRSRLLPAVVLVCVAALLLATPAACTEAEADNWAVIVSSSRYWLNYRHTANALGVYQAVRRLGIPDGRILLMLADQHGCSPRNLHPGTVFLAAGGPSSSSSPASAASAAGSPRLDPNLLAADVEVDYRGREVGVDALLRVLTGRHAPGTPPSKRLRSGPRSRMLLYLTGHGGDEFLKFHDQEELLAADLAAALAQAHAGGRYGELLLVADTCQASTLYSRLAAPHVLAVASSKLGQSSYAHQLDTALGLHVVDQMTFHLHAFLTGRLPPHAAAAGAATRSSGTRAAAASTLSLQQLLDYISGQRMSSEVQVRADLHPRRPADLPVTHFFGAASSLEAAAKRTGAAKAAAAALHSLAAQPGGRDAGAAPLGAAAAAAAAVRQQPGSGAQLFALLEATGGSRGGGGAPQALSQAAVARALATAATWAVAALLVARLMK